MAALKIGDHVVSTYHSFLSAETGIDTSSPGFYLYGVPLPGSTVEFIHSSNVDGAPYSGVVKKVYIELCSNDDQPTPCIQMIFYDILRMPENSLYTGVMQCDLL